MAEIPQPKLTIPELVRSSPVPVADSTVRRGVRDGRLPAEMILGKYRIAPADFENFLRAAPRPAAPIAMKAAR